MLADLIAEVAPITKGAAPAGDQPHLSSQSK
jgi:hypothetical protein